MIKRIKSRFVGVGKGPSVSDVHFHNLPLLQKNKAQRKSLQKKIGKLY